MVDFLCAVTGKKLGVNDTEFLEGDVVCVCHAKPTTSTMFPMTKKITVTIPCENQDAVDKITEFIHEGLMNMDDIKMGDQVIDVETGKFGEGC